MKNFSFRRALTYTQQKHRGQVRADNTPVWLHCFRVASLLEYVLKTTGEGAKNDYGAIILAGLGHDLLEDTTATEDKVKKIFGQRATGLICTLTNDWGDDKVQPYVQKVSTAEESVRLIKLADLCDNFWHATYNASLLGHRWIKNTFLPIVEPMRKAISKTSFTTYPQSAGILLSLVDIGYRQLTVIQARLHKTR